MAPSLKSFRDWNVSPIKIRHGFCYVREVGKNPCCTRVDESTCPSADPSTNKGMPEASSRADVPHAIAHKNDPLEGILDIRLGSLNRGSHHDLSRRRVIARSKWQSVDREMSEPQLETG